MHTLLVTAHYSNGEYRARPRIGTSGVLTDFNDTISVEPIVGEYGLHRANPANQDQEPIGQIYYRVSRSITASAKTWTNRKRVEITFSTSSKNRPVHSILKLLSVFVVIYL